MKENIDARSAREKRWLILQKKRNCVIRPSNRQNLRPPLPAFLLHDVTWTEHVSFNSTVFPPPSTIKENIAARSAREKRRLILQQKRNPKISPSNRENPIPCQPAFMLHDVPCSGQDSFNSSVSKPPSDKEARVRRQPIISRKRKRTGLTRKGVKPHNFRPPTMVCGYCGAIMLYQERNCKSWNPRKPNFSLCCSEGKVQLPLLKPSPPALKRLLDRNGGPLAKFYQSNMRMLNATLSFTSMGGNIDYAMNKRRGPRSFRLNGHNYHRIGSLIPPPGLKASFAQLYIHDTENKVRNRVEALNCDDTSVDIKTSVVDVLLQMLDDHNVLVKKFRMARDRFKESEVGPLRLHFLSNRSTNGRRYNLPTSAALIVGDFNVERAERDIIIDERSRGLKRISVLHPAFMAMQYPLLFPYGEDGFRLVIKHNVKEKVGNKETYVTMREFYAFRLQHRRNEGDTLLRGGML